MTLPGGITPLLERTGSLLGGRVVLASIESSRERPRQCLRAPPRGGRGPCLVPTRRGCDIAPVLQDILLILVFILIGGVFAAAEMSLVSLRESQQKQFATRGKRGAKVAELAASPNRFLSAVQIGVTLSGFLSAALGGATLSDLLAPVFVGHSPPDEYGREEI